PLNVELQPYQTLQIRAAERKRPVIRLLDYMADRPDAFTISGGLGSRFVLDGLLVTGRGMLVEGPDPNDTEVKQEDMCDVTIRHSRLVPGWGLTPDCDPTRPNEPSLELINSRAKLRIEHSIIGSIEVEADEVLTDPVEIIISDSILDATRLNRAVISSATQSLAFARVSLIRTTGLGELNTPSICLDHDSRLT